MRLVFAAVLLAALAVAIPCNDATAQSAAPAEDTKARTKAEKAAAKKAKAEARTQCGAEWQAMRAAKTIEKGMTWPKYYGVCSKRLKEKAT